MNITDEDKKRCLEEHFTYEVRMLIFSFNKFIEFKNINDQNSVNMALETFLLHARNLVEFFYFGKKNKYARASNYFAHENPWETIRPPETSSLKEVINRAGKQLAHLTYKRIYGVPSEKIWHCGEIFKDLLEVSKTFLDTLLQEYFGNELQNIKNDISNEIAKLPNSKKLSMDVDGVSFTVGT